jgi:hypothetical protein
VRQFCDIRIKTNGKSIHIERKTKNMKEIRTETHNTQKDERSEASKGKRKPKPNQFSEENHKTEKQNSAHIETKIKEKKRKQNHRYGNWNRHGRFHFG